MEGFAAALHRNDTTFKWHFIIWTFQGFETENKYNFRKRVRGRFLFQIMDIQKEKPFFFRNKFPWTWLCYFINLFQQLSPSTSIVDIMVLLRVLLFSTLFVLVHCDRDWTKLRNLPKNAIFSRGSLILSGIEKSIQTNNVNISNACKENLLKLATEFRNEKESALKSK